jgi:CheY-like chemotaxis protein
MRIFVVEDHEDSRCLLVFLLEQLGHSVESATTLTEALARIPEAGCDVLFSDIGLPDGNGWALMERLGRNQPPYAVAMSGFGMPSDRAHSLGVGYRHHLLKPFEPDRLANVLDEAVDVLAEGSECAAQRELFVD